MLSVRLVAQKQIERLVENLTSWLPLSLLVSVGLPFYGHEDNKKTYLAIEIRVVEIMPVDNYNYYYSFWDYISHCYGL